MKNEKYNYFWIFSEKYEKVSKKVKNDENGSDIEKKGQNWCEMKNKYFWIFSEKYGKISNKEKNNENGQILVKKVKIHEKWKK